MKKLLSLMLVVSFVLSLSSFAFATSGAPQPGWWVKEKGKEDGVWTNIQDDVDSLIQQYCEQYCVPGKDGKDGRDGIDGKDGVGVAPGGSTGQVLAKLSDADYDTGWIDVLTPDDLEDALTPIENWINGADNRFTNIENWMSNADHRFTNIENRLSDLEETQFILGLNVRIMDTKRTTLEAFADYSTNREKIDRYGVRLTLKLGKSYEEQLIEQLQAQIKEIKELLGNK